MPIVHVITLSVRGQKRTGQPRAFHKPPFEINWLCRVTGREYWREVIGPKLCRNKETHRNKQSGESIDLSQ